MRTGSLRRFDALIERGINLSRPEEFTPVFQRMIDEPDAWLDAVRLDAAGFERLVVSEEDGRHQPRATIPNSAFLGFLLFDHAGLSIALDRQDWVPEFASFGDLMREAEVRSTDGRLICFTDPGGAPTFALWAPLDETAAWNLPARVRQAAAGKPGCRIVLVAGGAVAPLAFAAEAYGLSGLQQRVVVAVVRAGSLRRAADALGISYATAREAMAGAAKRMHLRNTPAVVRALIEAAFGIMPGDGGGAALLADMVGLSERQATIALLISSGATREAAAKAVGTSPAVIKKELELLFAAFGLQSSAQLSRLIVEVRALRLFARSIDGAPGFLDPAIEPSRFTMRRNGLETISWSDYGPASGRPVLVVHSNWSCRAVPRPMLAALQANGWRPIAIDRPGYGGTHLGTSSVEDPFGQAVSDALQVLDTCGIGTVAVIARCGAQFVHALKSAAPERVGAVVLVSPTPQTSVAGRRTGVVGAVKEAFFRRPQLIQFFFRIICAQISPQRVEMLTRAIVKGSGVDERLCADPQFLRDRFRALRPFAAGNFMGGVFEELVISQGRHTFAPLDVRDWVILQGTDDNHNSVEEVASYWSHILPGTPLTPVEGGGRFLTSSHANLIVAELEALLRNAKRRRRALENT